MRKVFFFASCLESRNLINLQNDENESALAGNLDFMYTTCHSRLICNIARDTSGITFTLSVVLSSSLHHRITAHDDSQLFSLKPTLTPTELCKHLKEFSIHSDPRSTPSPRMNPFGPPNQSRSFKILQQVTNTFGEDSDDNEAEQQRMDNEPMQEQQPLFSRPLGPDEMNETQMRRLQLSDNDRSFMNRVKNQGELSERRKLT